MNLGSKLMNLRKLKSLSQEEVAEKLGVTRQTISKWETDQSTPDFDKILPLCKLYDITADELLTGKTNERISEENYYDKIENNKRKKAICIGLSIILYFIAVIIIMVTIPVFKLNPIIACGIFLLICGIATCIITYGSMVYKIPKEKEEPKNRLLKQVEEVLSLITLVIYFLISFYTMAWHITWLIWIIYALIIEIVKLIFILKESK